MKRELLSGDLDSIPQKITRALEDGPDYRPDWRYLQVQDYLNSIYQSDAEVLTRLDGILSEEPDPIVRDFLLFRCGRPCDNEEGIAYAVNCQRHNCNTLCASAIKMMVIANGSPERIADEFGTTKEKIETFEKSYFDARPYLKHRAWLRGICYPPAKPNAVVAVELRWFGVAFRRGWPGVEEMLGLVRKSGERTLQGVLSVLLGDVEDCCLGAEPIEKAIKALVSVVRIAPSLPYLWENPVEPEPSTDIYGLGELTFAQRERLRYFFIGVIDAIKDRPIINADDLLRSVFNGEGQVSMVQMAKLVSMHLR